ncbi:hypothetical protein [Shinella sp. DD12]|uniref:hypothetical protein n=1 Tax=Shinella sp. DD12 TaxID=1410620 RepID=UPI0003C54A94|nr:hypothetical protein [Shinella sp. DD12]EYR81868.1 hypothetical protein SHLA_4c001600 [Shinella sp. DD12]
MRIALPLAAALALAAPAHAEEFTHLQGALALEWMVAHCDFSQEHSLGVMVASMTINGSDPQLVAKDRTYIREQYARAPSVDEACASFKPPAKARPEYKTKQ